MRFPPSRSHQLIDARPFIWLLSSGITSCQALCTGSKYPLNVAVGRWRKSRPHVSAPAYRGLSDVPTSGGNPVKCSRGDQQIELTISGISLLETAGEDFDREA